MCVFNTRVNRFLAKVGIKKSSRLLPRRRDVPTRWRVQVQPVHRTRLDSLRAIRTQDWLIARHEVQMNPVPFCRGAFGKIHRGTWLGSRVVIKCVDISSSETHRAFVRETAIWKSLSHPHVVPLYGACISFDANKSDPGLLVCEEADNGSLQDFLFRQNEGGRKSVVWRLLRDAALGLHYLHERGIVHGDLKCNNIVVGKTGEAMLTDFGLSTIPAKELSSDTPHEAVGAFQWKAPELLGSNCSAGTFESDMYAFGMCVVEALRGGPPWGELPDIAVKFNLLRIKRSADEDGCKAASACIMPRPRAITNDEHWEFVENLCAFDPLERLKLPDAIKILEQFAREESCVMLDTSETKVSS